MNKKPEFKLSKKSKKKPIPVVAIGASAGGLEAVSELFKNLSPKTGRAYVYIQHLDPTHKNMLPAILGKTTKMPVKEAENLLAVKPNHVYIIPPDKDMLLIDGVVKLNTRAPRPTLHLPINRFFTLLAEKHGEDAIAVLLSGTGRDGTAGMRDIKIAGGITFAQNKTAKFDGMPQSAIAEGVADMVLSPKEIAKELELLAAHTGSVSVSETTVADEDDNNVMTDESLTGILQILKKATDVDFAHYKKNTIKRRVLRRMIIHKHKTPAEYETYLKNNKAEPNILYQDLLINVTSFFRDMPAMEYLKKTLLPRILKTKGPKDALRIWVSACSTGEEAYSVAMILAEIFGDKPNNVPVHIFATDLSEKTIAKARTGVYTREELVNVSPKRLNRFFTKIDGSYRITKAIREMCVFAPHNIFKDPPFSRLDLITCCNFLIYVDAVLQKKIISLFHYALRDSGYLMLGKSETIGESAALFSTADKKFKVYSKKKEIASSAAFDLTYRVPESEKVRPVLTLPKIERVTGKVAVLEKTVDHILLERYVPASVVINRDLEILQFRGSTGLFLEPSPGKASLNLLKMARESLGFEVRSAVNKVVKSGQPYKKAGLKITHKNIAHHVNFEVIPLKTENNERHFLVVFAETLLPGPGRAGPSTDKRVVQLEQELMAAREDMRTIIEEQETVNEELQSANEEIVSSNEELQSINEELETSKEEIESSNEELMTINHEMQTRNEQLMEAQEYSDTVLATIREGVLVMDAGLKIKSANKTFYNIFKLQKEDIEGKHIYALDNYQWDIPRMHELFDVLVPRITQLQGFEVKQTFKNTGPKTLMLNVRKLSKTANRAQVILLAIEDVTEQAAALQIIAEREGWLQSMANNIPAMVWISDTNQQRIFFNDAWLQFTGKNMAEELGDKWLADIHPEDKIRFVTEYGEALNEKRTAKLEYRLRRYDGEYRWVVSVGKPTYSGGDFTGFIGTCTEIHDQVLINKELEEKVQRRTSVLQQTNTNLERSNSELEQFVYVASHDLQEPLRKIRTFSNLLLQRFKNDIPDEGAVYIDKIATSAGRMTTLIDDLLKFSRVARPDEKFELTDLNAVLKNVLKDFDLAIGQKEAQLNVELLPRLLAVPVQMKQLFTNLISNALKFSSAQRNPVINITSRHLSAEEVATHTELKKKIKYYDITVSDNGIGFEPKFAQQIFVIFQRLNEDKAAYPGTGIGLALCKKIVNFHNGAIYAVGQQNEGVSFHVILPAE